MKEKGLAFLPLILGIIFILLLGGVGLGLINEDIKISKGLKEVQKLEETENPSEAIKKLEELENSFLVKYFGIKKDGIDNEIEKNKKLLEEAQKGEEEISEEKPEEKPEEEMPQILDCQDILSCLIESAKTCTPSKLKDEIEVLVGSYLPTISFFGQIKGKEAERCLIYIRTEKLIDFKFSQKLVNEKLKSGLSMDEIKKEEEEMEEKVRPFIEGAEEICLFRNEDLVKWLEIVGTGELPSFEGAECKYHGFQIEMLKNL